MSEVTVGIIGILLLIGSFFTGIKLGYGMSIIGFLGLVYLGELASGLQPGGQGFLRRFTSYGFTVITTCSLLMGQVASNSDIAKKLYASAEKFVGHIPGGLAMTTVVGATLFKAMCGSTLATCATFAGIAMPEMTRLGYSKKLSTGVVASVGTLGMLIPPSVPLIIYGIITEQSIGKLFLAGIIPGLAHLLSSYSSSYGWVKIDPSIAQSGAESHSGTKVKAAPEFLWVGDHLFRSHRGLMTGVVFRRRKPEA